MCLFPVKAQSQEIGKPKPSLEGDLVLPCGKCTECISKRAIEWALRARHEISCHKENCFITLTYDEDHLPSIFLIKDEFQKFMKRLRKKTKLNLRYMVSHEYGSQTFRPHHHALIFGWNPDNQRLLKTTKSGEKLFTSSCLRSLWTSGFSSVGTATERSAYYIASYSLKGKRHTLTDPKSGEIIQVSDCMDASKRPAIGYEYFKNNLHQLIYSRDIMPRYYLKRLKEENPLLHERYENDLLTKLKTRDSYELLAKYVLDRQKISDSELRSAPLDFESDMHHKMQLTYNRDETHRLLTKETSNV